MKIEIEYDGGYPNLCRGNLVVVVNGKRWDFPDYCLNSGGGVTFDEEWSEHVAEGPWWSVDEWPEGFPQELQRDVLAAINDEIPHGCCGGCV